MSSQNKKPSEAARKSYASTSSQQFNPVDPPRNGPPDTIGKTCQASEKIYRLAFTSSKDAIAITRLNNGCFVEVNQAFLDTTGYTRREIIGNTVSGLKLWANNEDRKELMRELENHGAHTNLEAKFRCKDGALSTGLMFASVIDLDGEAHVFSITRDIGLVRRMEKERTALKLQLERARKMDALGALAGGVAHDFNNILAAIMGYSEMALETIASQDPLYEDISDIFNAAVRGKQLVKQILTFSRKVKARRQPLDLNQTVSGSLIILDRRIPERITVRFNMDNHLPMILADPQQIEQIVINLVANSLDAVSGPGAITVTTAKAKVKAHYCETCGKTFSGDFAILSVHDTGWGIDPKVQNRIFEPFFTTKEEGRGTGLGLSTVAGIVGSHGGHICCLSEKGAGSEFIVYLPLAEDDSGLKSKPPQTLQKQDPGENLVLFVDDEASIRTITTKMLTSKGYRVLCAGHGEEALDVYRKNFAGIQAVFLDLGMPGMGGKTCLKKILRINPKAKVIITSGNLQQELSDELSDLGAWDTIGKPFYREQLLACLSRALDE